MEGLSSIAPEESLNKVAGVFLAEKYLSDQGQHRQTLECFWRSVGRAVCVSHESSTRSMLTR